LTYTELGQQKRGGVVNPYAARGAVLSGHYVCNWAKKPKEFNSAL
jgi:hypothetical protein